MFVKNLVNVCVSTMNVGISHESTTLYSGTAENVPFYLLNEKVIEIGIFGTTLLVKI